MNIKELAEVIQKAMTEYMDTHDEPKQRDVELVGLAAGMRFSKGRANPELIHHLISLERSVYKGREIFLQC